MRTNLAPSPSGRACGGPVGRPACHQRRTVRGGARVLASAAAPGQGGRGAGPSAARSPPAAPPAAASSSALPAEPARDASSLPLAPGDPPALGPLGDQTAKLVASPFEYGLDGWRRFGGGVFRAPVLLSDSVYMLTTVQAMVDVLADDGYSVAFNNSEAFRRLMADDYSNRTMSDGDARRRQRKLMAPAFSNEALNAYVPIMGRVVEQGLERLASADGRAFDLRSEIRTLTVDLANNLLVGLTGLDGPTKRELQDVMDDFFAGTQAQVVSELPGSTFARGLAAKRRLFEMLQPRLAEQRDALLAQGRIGGGGGDGGGGGTAKPRKSVLAYIMEARIQMGDAGALDDLNALTYQCIGMLMAGVDTSSSSFTSLLCALTQLPEVVEDLRREQAAVISDHGPQITRAALDAMPRLDAVVKEVQYIQPAGPTNFRHALRDLDIGGRRVPKGALMLLNWHVAHMIEDAEQTGRGEVPVPTKAHCAALDREYLQKVFRPERWGPSGIGGRKPTILSFHTGPHTCLGMMLYTLEAKALVAALLRSYDLDLLAEPSYIPWTSFPLSNPDKRWPLWARLRPLAAGAAEGAAAGPARAAAAP